MCLLGTRKDLFILPEAASTYHKWRLCPLMMSSVFLRTWKQGMSQLSARQQPTNLRAHFSTLKSSASFRRSKVISYLILYRMIPEPHRYMFFHLFLPVFLEVFTVA